VADIHLTGRISCREFNFSPMVHGQSAAFRVDKKNTEYFAGIRCLEIKFWCRVGRLLWIVVGGIIWIATGNGKCDNAADQTQTQ
jgi:hypothetical protein